MELIPQIYHAKIFHKRLFPKINQFVYGAYYLALPLPAKKLPSRFLSFNNKDHGFCDGRDVYIWAREILEKDGLNEIITNIILITMPSILGYVFNPVSFFLNFDKDKQLRAVICEVHNTFKEQHSYLCIKADHSPISKDEWLEADKLFHVSPFLERNGYYKFRFALADDNLGIWIDYFDEEGNKQLATSLTGNFGELNAKSLRFLFWRYPFVTVKVITLIHWQAIKLLSKGIRYIAKPPQFLVKITKSKD